MGNIEYSNMGADIYKLNSGIMKCPFDAITGCFYLWSTLQADEFPPINLVFIHMEDYNPCFL